MFPPARRRFSRTKPLRMTFPPVEGGGRKSLSVGVRSKDTPRTDLSISGEMVPSIVAEDGIALGVYCRLAGGQPIHFGREDGVERTLLRVACQSETFLASPWQGDANIRFLWHIGCQSDFDELVSMACRPVDRGFCRMGETKVPFHPVKWRFARTQSSKTYFIR